MKLRHKLAIAVAGVVAATAPAMAVASGIRFR